MREVQELLGRQMTRKEFLQYFALAVLTLFGVTNFINLLSKNSPKQTSPTKEKSQTSSADGFGSRKFGV